MDGGSNGGTVCKRRPYSRVILGVWFTAICRIEIRYNKDNPLFSIEYDSKDWVLIKENN